MFFLGEMLTCESPEVTAMIPPGWKGFLPTQPSTPTPAPNPSPKNPKTLMLPFFG